MTGPKEKTIEITNFILENLEKHPDDIIKIATDKFAISKQATRNHVQKLVSKGIIFTKGITKNKTYFLAKLDDYKISYPISSELSEDVIWRQNIRPRLDGINQNILDICQYGFTEMVNNVIDHSEGHNLKITLQRTATCITINIADNGIGIFNKISSALGLTDKIHVILELAKGKLTTDPKHHTGEGIFFTSRAFDKFSIISGNLVFSHTISNNDWLFEEKENIVEGTFVSLRINLNSHRLIKDIFDQYTDDEDYGFSKTFIPVTLARYGEENLVSRSQAKRLLTRFDKFKEIVLDFNKVEVIGQAFADEIFRVFAMDHPAIHLYYVNANTLVEKMIKRAKSVD